MPGAMCALVKGQQFTRASQGPQRVYQMLVCPLVFTLLRWSKALAYTRSEILQLDLDIEVVKIFMNHSGYTMNVQMKEWIGLLSNNVQAQSSAQTPLSALSPNQT